MRSARSEVCLRAGRREKLLATASLVNIMGRASFNASGYAGPVSARADPSSRQRYMPARSKTVSLAPTPRGSRAARQNREKQQFRCHTASSRHGTCCTHTAAATTLRHPHRTHQEHKHDLIASRCSIELSTVPTTNVTFQSRLKCVTGHCSKSARPLFCR